MTTTVRLIGLVDQPGPHDTIILFAGYDDETGDLVRVAVDSSPASEIAQAICAEGEALVQPEGWQVASLPQDWPVLLPA